MWDSVPHIREGLDEEGCYIFTVLVRVDRAKDSQAVRQSGSQANITLGKIAHLGFRSCGGPRRWWYRHVHLF